MQVSRRAFLGATTGLAAGLVLGARNAEGNSRVPPAAGRELDCVLVAFPLMKLDDCCASRESLRGYETALRECGARFVISAPDAVEVAHTVVVPGCVRLDPNAARRLSESLQEGSLVLLESGAGFAGPADFETHQQLLASHFGLDVARPLHLWERAVGEGSAMPPSRRSPQNLRPQIPRRHPAVSHPGARVPYVDYVWPVRAKIRDFSCVVPLSTAASQTADGAAWDVIGRAEGWAVAAKRKVGKGIVVFLGSPLGPALWSGDREARGWLRELLVSA